MTQSFIYEGVDYGEVMCSPQALAAARQAQDNKVIMPEFFHVVEKHIKQQRPEWNIERLFDYAGPRAIMLLLGATEEEAEQYPIISENWRKKLGLI